MYQIESFTDLAEWQSQVKNALFRKNHDKDFQGAEGGTFSRNLGWLGDAVYRH